MLTMSIPNTGFIVHFPKALANTSSLAPTLDVLLLGLAAEQSQNTLL